MRVVGVLAGVGTLLYEAREAGMDVAGNFETRSYFRTIPDVWHLNFPEAPFFTDLKNLGGNFNDADLILGHPPCGSHSVLGVAHSLDKPAAERAALAKRRAARTGLLPLFVESINTLRPRAFALDNLPKILSTVAPPAWWEAELPDYRLTYAVIKNWDYGTPQLRERLWVIGVRRPSKAFVLREPLSRLAGPLTAWESFNDLPWHPEEDIPELAHVHSRDVDRPFGSYPTTDPVPQYIERTDELAYRYLAIPPMSCWPYRTRTTNRLTRKLGRVRLTMNEKSRVISGGTLQHPITGWTLTARERARIMDWPDAFQLWNGERTFDRSYHSRLMLFTGKAVPSRFPRFLIPQLIRHLRRN